LAMAYPEMSAALEPHESRSGDALRRVPCARPGREAIILDARDQGRRRDALQWPRAQLPGDGGFVAQALRALAEGFQQREHAQGAPLLLLRRCPHVLDRGPEDRLHHRRPQEVPGAPEDEVRSRQAVEKRLRPGLEGMEGLV